MVSAAVLLSMRVVGATAMFTLTVFALRNRDSPGADSLAVLTTGVVIWLVSDALILFVDSMLLKDFLLSLVYTGIAMLIAGWGLFAIEFTGFGGTYARPASWTLAALMTADILLVWTNRWHGTFFESTPAAGNVWGAEFTYGPAYTVHVAYSYVVVVAGIVLLVALLYRSQLLYQGQVYQLVGAIVIGWSADIAFQLGFLGIELTPIAISASALLLGAAVFRFKFMDIAPVAQDTIIENITDGVLVVDREESIVEINERGAELFEFDPEAARGRDVPSLLDRVPAFASQYRTLDDSQRIQTFEFEDDGRHFTVQVTTLKDHHDRLVGRQFLVHEVTEQRRYQELLERQNEQLDRFASVVSHDLRNPLNVAMSSLELVRETGDTDQLDKVADAHERMEDLIEEMLDLARHGQRVTDRECLSLETVAREAWANVETEDATLTVADPASLEADHDRLLQLCENLFRNSLDHAGSDVAVTVGPLHGEDGFFVADDGPGIPPEDRDAVFEHNFTTAKDGTGLGLFIVDSIVTAHDWSIAVTESDDGGARFEIRDVDSCDRDAEGPTSEDTDAQQEDATMGWADREWVTGSGGENGP
jgi:PAS domain S-box-containing protein